MAEKNLLAYFQKRICPAPLMLASNWSAKFVTWPFRTKRLMLPIA